MHDGDYTGSACPVVKTGRVSAQSGSGIVPMQDFATHSGPGRLGPKKGLYLKKLLASKHFYSILGR